MNKLFGFKPFFLSLVVLWSLVTLLALAGMYKLWWERERADYLGESMSAQRTVDRVWPPEVRYTVAGDRTQFVLALESHAVAGFHPDIETLQRALSRTPPALEAIVRMWLDVKQWNIVLWLCLGFALAGGSTRGRTEVARDSRWHAGRLFPHRYLPIWRNLLAGRNCLESSDLACAALSAHRRVIQAKALVQRR